MPRSGTIEAVISDFGGVLTTPLAGAFAAFAEWSGVSTESLGQAMATIAEHRGINPLFELETGHLGESAFLEMLGEQLGGQEGRRIELTDFGERFFAHLRPNVELIAYMRDLRARGYRLAICTNNVREWEHRWRAMLPIDDIFDVVVDSAFVGIRKPDPRIYELTLERLGACAARTLFIDDIAMNCDAARELGMRTVWFCTTDQAIEDSEAALAASG